MKIRLLSTAALVLSLVPATFAQQPPPSSGGGPAQGQGPGGGRGGWGGMGGFMRGLTGTVTAVAADHYTIKTDAGEIYTVNFSVNTRIMKQQVRMRGQGGGGEGMGGNPPETLKSTDIKVGDVIAAMGEINATAKSVGATMVMQVDPERAKQMREMQANYGKTWLAGKVTAISEAKVSLLGMSDNVAYTFVANENTTFRKRREPITLADIQLGDNIRVEGALKDGVFIATAVSVMGMPQGETPSVPRNAPPAVQPK